MTLLRMLIHSPDVPAMTILGPTSCLSEVYQLCGKDRNQHGIHLIPDMFANARQSIELHNKILAESGRANVDFRVVVEIGDLQCANPEDFAYVFIMGVSTVRVSDVLRFLNYCDRQMITGLGFFDAYYIRVGNNSVC